MGYRHQYDDLLDTAVELALDEGLSSLTFGRLARALDTNDRTIVYYFPTKHDLITDVVHAIGNRLHALLDRAFGPDPLSFDDLLQRGWPVLASRPADRILAVRLELIGLAATHQEPYEKLAPLLVGGWVDWLIPHIAATAPRSARAEASAVVAQLDGLLILRQISGTKAANAAARHLGIAE